MRILLLIPTDTLPIQQVVFLIKEQDGVELVRANFLEGEREAQLQGSAHVQRAPHQQPRGGRLRRIELVERAVPTPATVLRRVRAQARVAQLLAPERPVHQEPDGRLVRPLPYRKFAPLSSSKLASSASMAAFAATALWMSGTGPA
jgi:hypothetical protein